MNRHALLVLLLAAVLASLCPAHAADRANKPWLFFDLGDTIVQTAIDPATHDMVKVSWMRFVDDDGQVTDAHTYMQKMQARGYPVGLIVNIPQSWGDPDLKRAKQWLAETDPVKRQALAAALTRTKRGVIADFFEGRGPGDPPDHARRWNDPAFPSMDWDIFQPQFLLVPFFDENRKPDRAPYTSEDQLFLFQQAVRMASRANTHIVYQGENRFEIDAAKKVGLFTRLVPYKAGAAVQVKGFFASEAEINTLVPPGLR